MAKPAFVLRTSAFVRSGATSRRGSLLVYRAEARPHAAEPARLRTSCFSAAAFATALQRAKAGGAKEARTPDLLNAIQALYQLSYDPIHQTEPQFIFSLRQVKTFCRRK